MLFAGIDPGSESYAIAVVDELGRIKDYFEIPTSLIVHESINIAKYIYNLRPKIITLPSGHGLPFFKSSKITNKELFLLTLADPEKEGPLRSLLLSLRSENAFTIPSVIELDSVDAYKKINKIDMGTADKVSSAFFYRTMFDSFVLVEVGRHFSSIIIVKDGVIIDGFGGTEIPGFISPGCLDGEVVYLLHKFSTINKNTIYTNGDKKRSIDIIKIIAEWYSLTYKLPIIISGKGKNELDFGIKMEFKFKEAAVGAAYIANALGGGIFAKYIDMLNSHGTAIDYVRLQGWEEVISWIKTL
ncbi:DUF1464 domain-containing protein [Acidianus sulfidivorans JP7]|uniref:DUF1464 domain-containing protein n=1 Tax=Acidianus sulfidivorans JP7 TaxID=619593 RepID=A0A2U9IMR4_9CREN|nr:DUF1464 family protein [Acidianus sulfidivorans]AWR97313.1 DUF1464 domain-containing protein [Acidianus sulfidivorans JP7]